MNKKFSTLMACLLAGTTLTVSAHVPEYRTMRTYAGITAKKNATINHIQADKWYQLRTTLETVNGPVPALLIQVRDVTTGKLSLKAVPETDCYSVFLLPSLWRIQYTEKDGVGGGKFTFVNKATGMTLAYDHTYSATATTDAPSSENVVLEACNTTWEWYNNNSQPSKFDKVAPYAYTDNNDAQGQVMILKAASNGTIYSFVGKSSDLLDNHGVLASTDAIKIQPVVATAIELDPKNFNSMIDFNKQSANQYAGFKFYKPNGDLLNPVEMENLNLDGAMEATMEYQAEPFNYDKLFNIQKKAYEQLGGKENLASYQQAYADADKDYREAEKVHAKAKADELAFRTEYENLVIKQGELDLQLQRETKSSSANAMLAAINTAVDCAIYNENNWITISGSCGLTLLDPNGQVNSENAHLSLQKAIEKWNSVDNAEVIAKANAGNDVVKKAQRFYKYWVAQAEQDYWVTRQAQVNIPTEHTTFLADLNGISKELGKVNKELPEKEIAKEEAMKNTDAALAVLIKKEEIRDKALKDLDKLEDGIISNTSYILHGNYMRLKHVATDGVPATDGYLMVDTAFWQTDQVPSKADLKIVHSNPKATDSWAIDARYFFKLTYFPTQDSLVVEPMNASAISDAEYNNSTAWSASYAGNNFVYTNDVSQKASAPSNTITAKGDKTNLPIVLKLDVLNTSGFCLTAARANKESDSWLKTRIAFNNPYEKDYLKRFTPEEGLYFIKSKRTGKYVVANLAGNLQYDVPETGAQDYNNMPATMFVVERPGCQNGTRSLINNREYGNWTVNGNFEGQLYEDEDGIYIINKNYPNQHVSNYNLAYNDHYEFIPVEDKDALTSDKHGYQYLDPETLPYTEYAIHYNLAANQNLYLNVEDGFVKGTEGANTYYELSTVNPINGKETVVNAFGYKSLNLPQLERQAYVLKVRDANLVDNDTTYVALVTENGQNEYYKAMGIKDIRAGKGQLAQFYLKADQLNDTTKYYALVDIRENTYMPMVNNGARIAKYTDANGYISHMDMNNQPSERVSAFALVKNDRPLYREVTDETINLFNNQNEKAVEDGMFLGFAKDNSKNGAMAVERLATDNARMPQYLLGFDKDSIADGYWCENNTHGYFATEDEAKAKDENHYVKYNGYTTGRYLVSFVDSVMGNEGSHAYNKVAKYTYKGVAVRLGFVEGVHMVITADEAKYINEFLGTEIAAGEYFFTLVGGHTLADLKNEQGYIVPEKLFSAEYTKMNTYTTGKHNSWSFSFRLVDDNQDNFLVESNLPGVSSIGSMEGAWIKDYENVPVVSYIDGNHSTIEASDLKKDNVTDGTIFTLEATDEEATANEEISAGNVIVAGTNGAVVVKGAEGKNVIVSTILGKVVANEVVSSDNATIAAPQGVVVVSVDGESFKVVVK